MLGDARLNLLDEKTKFAIYSLKFGLETAEIWVGLKIGDAHTHRHTDRQTDKNLSNIIWIDSVFPSAKFQVSIS